MATKAKHAFGSSSAIESALEQGLIDARDILFLDEDTDKPKIGWITKDGKPVILTDEKADLSEIEADVEALESQIATKADSSEVEELGAEVAKKVDVETVQSMINEATVGVIEVVEF